LIREGCELVAGRVFLGLIMEVEKCRGYDQQSAHRQQTRQRTFHAFTTARIALSKAHNITSDITKISHPENR